MQALWPFARRGPLSGRATTIPQQTESDDAEHATWFGILLGNRSAVRDELPVCPSGLRGHTLRFVATWLDANGSWPILDYDCLAARGDLPARNSVILV